ncbi:MAG: hypothetical protein QM725_06385 [Lacibacter sp.]
MKKELILLTTVTVLLFSCKQDTKKETVSSKTDKSSSIESLHKKTKNEIVGLWKLYKTKDVDGNTYNEQRNDYMNIKDNNSFEEHDTEGMWILSFGFIDSSQTKVGTFLTKILNPNTTNPDTYIYSLNKKEENGTTYLITTNLDDYKQKYYIRQQ